MLVLDLICLKSYQVLNMMKLLTFGVPNDPETIIAQLVQFKHGTSPPSSCLISILRRLQQYEFMI